MIPGQVTLLAHADWSVNPRKRWCAYAIQEGESRYRAWEPVQVVHPSSLIQQLEEIAGPFGCAVVGFDFPIGLPHRYAEKAGIIDFLDWLPGLGLGEWSDFYEVPETREQISLHRPFYPKRPGGAARQHLTSQLGMESFDDLFRECERAYHGRRAACPLFWTLGGQQVGKAALSGWKEVLVPALSPHEIRSRDTRRNPAAITIWPFSGAFETLLQPGATVVVEMYPAEVYRRIGIRFSPNRPGNRSGKRDRWDRAAQAPSLLSWASACNLALEPALERSILDGFGASPDGEDRFDAVAGLFGMLDVLERSERFVEPESERIRSVEGWIFGQDPGTEQILSSSVHRNAGKNQRRSGDIV